MFLIFVVISMLTFDLPIAKAADETVLTLSLPTDIEEEAVPGTEIVVPLTIVDGYDTGDEVEVVQIVIEYDSSVASVEDTSIGWKDITDGGIVIDVLSFGILSGWDFIANTVPPEKLPQLPNAEWLKIGMLKTTGGSLQNPGLPAELLTIKFTVQSSVPVSTDLLFIDDENTFFAKSTGDKLLLDGDTQNGQITLTEPPPPTPITLSMPTIVIPILQEQDEELMPLTVVDGYTADDQIEVVQIVIEYDSSVASVEDTTIGYKGISDGGIIIDVLSFGILSGWSFSAGTGPPEESPQLPNAEWLKIGMLKTTGDPLQNPGLPAELLTIKFTAVSDEPTDTTRVLFINENHTFFAKGDGTKLPVDLEDDPHGDIKLPVVLSALGAIWHPNGAKIFWEAESQQGNLGWNIYRSETKDGKFVKINGELIKGAGTTSNPMKYSFIDKDAEKGKIYYYYLEDISFNGEKHRTDLIRSIPVNKVTSWGDIKRSALR